jgi:hypothetical protein
MPSRATEIQLPYEERSLSEYEGNPSYFFNTEFLLANVHSLAGWNSDRLEAALMPRFDHALSRMDLRFPVANGFHVVFANPSPVPARQTANAICADILRHFFGEGAYTDDHIARFCHPTLARDVIGTLSGNPEQQSDRDTQSQGKAGIDQEEVSETEKDKRLFVPELLALYHAAQGQSLDDGSVVFSPCWDRKRGAVTSFTCEQAKSSVEMPAFDYAALRLPNLKRECLLDIVVLAAVGNAVRHILGRGDIAAVNVPVHSETLCWLKTRTGYFDVLGQIEPNIRALLAVRMIGFSAGSTFSAIAQWNAAIRQHVRWSFVHLPNANVDLSRVGNLGSTGFGLSVRPFPTPNGSLSALTGDVDKLKRICLSQNAVSCVDGVRTADELNLLIERGVRMIAGPAIGTHSKFPGPVRAGRPQGIGAA